MDYYEIFFDLKDSGRDLEFSRDLRAYLGHLQESGAIEGYKLRRRKLGLAPPEFADFNVTIETRDLAQLEQAFRSVAPRTGELEELHRRVNSACRNLRFALYRDFPDPERS